MNLHQTAKPLSVLAAALVLAACGGGGGNSNSNGNGAAGGGTVNFSAQSVVDNEADNIITQTYANLNTAAANLLTAIQALAAGGATEPE
jgi:ABC-type glycerol-3-phosphate transport system substrate-binding protein